MGERFICGQIKARRALCRMNKKFKCWTQYEDNKASFIQAKIPTILLDLLPA